jgi:hypothetical protein
MPSTTLISGRTRRHVTVVPASGLAFHLTEAWLSARNGSWFPTNGAGPDEDVNVYVSHLLAGFARAASGAPATAPLLAPPSAGSPRATRAEHYRRHADRLLIHLGLFPRGDGARRRPSPWGFSDAEARARDLANMTAYYGCAAALLDRGPHAGLQAVMEKLAAHGEDYVHALQALATRHLGLGARLADADLDALLEDESREKRETAAVADVMTPRADADSLDVVLDVVLEYRRRPTPELRRRLTNLARPLGLDADRLLAAGR